VLRARIHAPFAVDILLSIDVLETPLPHLLMLPALSAEREASTRDWIAGSE
jgi:hypothetical protein